MAGPLYLPLVDNLAQLWPDSLFERPPLEELEGVWFEPFKISTSPHLKIETGLLFERACEIAVPGLSFLKLVLGADGAETNCLFQLEADTAVRGRLVNVPVVLRIGERLLRPATPILDSDGNITGYEIDHDAESLDVTVASVTVTVGSDGRITVEADAGIHLPLCSIGETGVLVEGIIEFDLTPEAPSLRIQSARVVLPEGLPAPAGTAFSIQDARLDSTGFTGAVAVDLPLRYDAASRQFVYGPPDENDPPQPATLTGFSGGLRHVGLSFEQNRLTGTDLTGALVVPYFDEAAEIRFNLGPSNAPSITLTGVGDSGLTLTKDELLALNLKSLAVSTADGRLVVSGALEPLLMSSDGLQWPRLEVTDLSIDTTGKFSIKEAWLDLKELATLDLWGFHFELRRIGIGSEERDNDERLWIDLSGGLRLIEQIPVGLDVEGFRLSWPRDLLPGPGAPDRDAILDAVSKIEVEFDGIHLFFGVPDAVEFEGLIRFIKDAQVIGFMGDVALRVPASGFAAEAGLLVGLSFDPPFPFLYVYFGVELPAGIPLGQSGLALKGALGMLGLNTTPNKTEDQNWYYDWYKGGSEPGAHQAEKWRPEQSALALGVGVTITTADGYVKGVRGLIVLALPGPVLMIEGRALILSGLQPNAEPPLRALAVFDGGAGTVQFNIEAEATLVADLLKAYGMLEAFFDFKDLTNWHMYLGQDTPRDRRIRAGLLKLGGEFLFKADAYLMMDMVGAQTLRSRIGASIGFEPDVPDIGPVVVEFAATLEGDGLVTARPEQFSGQVELSADIRLSAFEVSVEVSADAQFLTEGPRPLKVGGLVEVEAEMPAPLDPFEASLEFELKLLEAPQVVSPLSEIAVSSRFEPDGGGFSADALRANQRILPLDRNNLDDVPWEGLAKASPLVPVDSQPIIGFRQKMNSPINSFARHPDGSGHHYNVGPLEFSPSLTVVELHEHLKSEDDWTVPWRLIASTVVEKQKPLPGVWLAESEPESPEVPSPRRLQLWTDNPLSSTARALGSGYILYRGAVPSGTSLAGRLLYDYPDLMRCAYTKVEHVCVDFKTAGDVALAPGETWGYKGLFLSSTSRTATVRVRHSRPSGLFRRALAALLGFIAAVLRWVATWKLFLPTRLFSRAVEALLKFVEWLIESLLSRGTEEVCLQVDGDLDIHFSRRVRSVRIILCEDKKIPEEETGWAITARRRSRTVTELNASGAGTDPRACNVEVAADLDLSEREWQLEADAGFDCVHIVRMGRFAIREICYTTVEEAERARLATEQCNNNLALPEPGPVLRPGAFYRLDVITEVSGEVNLPSTGNSYIDEMLETAYDQLMRLGTRSFFETCLFQTEGPPTNLRPYIKWMSPQHQSERFFYGDDIVIRFLRSNPDQMFGPPFELKVQIRDAQGQLVCGVQPPRWGQSRSSTRFPEESVWEEHRETLDWPTRAAPNDVTLLVSLAPLLVETKLLPRARYQLEIVRAEHSDETVAYWYFVATYSADDIRVTNVFQAKGTAVVVSHLVRVALGGFRGELSGADFPTLPAAEQDRDARWHGAGQLSINDPLSPVLFSSTFVTSGFKSFQELVASYSGEAKLIPPKGNYRSALSSLPEIQQTAGALAHARRVWERAEVDYRFETLKDGRKGLEAARLVKREAEAAHDALFRALAESLADLYFRPVADSLELYLLRDPRRGRVVGAWLRAPESLDLRLSVTANADDPAEYVGRTEVRLVSRTDPSAVNPIVTLHNADSTQLLILPELTDDSSVLRPREGWDGEYAFVFTYHRDYGDETGASDHRYDRPVEHTGGDVEEQVEWSWHSSQRFISD